jgi:hypothetical protein
MLVGVILVVVILDVFMLVAVILVVAMLSVVAL